MTTDLRIPFAKGGTHRATLILVLLLLGIFTALRLLLAVTNAEMASWSASTLIGSLALGFAYDLAVACALSIPYGLTVALVPRRWRGSIGASLLLALIFGATVFGGLFQAVAEWLFWDEFSTRFNFIAVDYLVYTNEVLGNIRESYNVGPIMAGIAALTGIVIWLMRRTFAQPAITSTRFAKWRALALHCAITAVLLGVLNGGYREVFANTYTREIAGNGLFELIRAFKNNEIEFSRFYAMLPRNTAQSVTQAERALSGWRPVSADASDLRMHVDGIGKEIKPNVVIICMESMSADYMGTFGGKRQLTPNLDRLASETMFFNRAFASGTRTVRGLEALALSVPPTPGSSIVRRPRNENLFSLGAVFNSKGYKSRFIYGGYGYFDNMNYFFANNGYEVSDRTSVPNSKIHHENVWGIADEDLFTQAMDLFDVDAREGHPFFAHIMTTSNHRPYTYPDGRIDIPSKSGREGAVKYSDWAIGDFLKRAQSKPWFDNTIFVIVADHQASSAGKTDLPLARYHIPLMLYAPKLFTPQRIDRVIAQIDVAPTLLGLLNWSYTTKFFGHDLNKLPPGKERVLISTYQKVGYLEDGKLVILEPGKKVRTEAVDWTTLTSRPTGRDERIIQEAISLYQEASAAFDEGRMSLQ